MGRMDIRLISDRKEGVRHLLATQNGKALTHPLATQPNAKYSRVKKCRFGQNVFPSNHDILHDVPHSKQIRFDDSVCCSEYDYDGY